MDKTIFGHSEEVMEISKQKPSLIKRMTNTEIVKASVKKNSNNIRHNKVLPCNKVIKGDLEK